MRSIFFLCSAALALISCTVKPEPLVYGKDACYACKMTLVDQKFGAEILTRKGKVYKFDDINCMVGFLKSGFESYENVQAVLAADFQHEGSLIEVNEAGFLHSEGLNTPMGSGVGVFVSQEEALLGSKGLHGEVLDWEKIKKKF